jgi:hypothetical protein
MRAIALGVRRGCIFAHSFIRVRLFINVRSSMLSIVGQGDVIKCRASMLDHTGALIGE